MVVLFGLTLAGFFLAQAYIHAMKAREFDRVISGQYSSNPQGAACVEAYYKKYPSARPENHKPGNVYLPPPCPGVPQ